MYAYLKAIHIIFIVTWFAGMFYIVRLFIYNREACDKEPLEKDILQSQFRVMIRRLWLGITWPSAILTAIMGPWVMINGGWQHSLTESGGRWLLIKLIFVAFLYFYHLILHSMYRQQMQGIFKYSSQSLRIWNEAATLFLVSIVVVATVKSAVSIVWGIASLVGLVIFLLLAIRIYKKLRSR